MSASPSYEQSKQVAEASRETEWKLPSFGRELFLGNFRLDLIHPQVRTGVPVRVTSLTSTTPRVVVTSSRRPARVASMTKVCVP